MVQPPFVTLLDPLAEHDLGCGHQTTGELLEERFKPGLGGFAVCDIVVQFPVENVGYGFGCSAEPDRGLTRPDGRKVPLPVRPFHVSDINNAGKLSVVLGYSLYQLLKFLDLSDLDVVDADFYKGSSAHSSTP